MKHVHYLQHVPFEGLGSIKAWLSERDMELTHTRLYDGERLPAVDEFDWLVVLGGPMGVHDEDQYPWLKVEKDLIGAALDAGKGVIGICLGAQLVAEALGARVTTGETEIGWLPVQATDAGRNHPIGQMLDGQTVLHWHDDVFSLPTGATLLAGTEANPNQAFVYGEKVLGLQFHLETTFEDAERMCRESHPGSTPSPTVQPPEDILHEPDRFLAINGMMKRVLEYMLLRN
jgi:GMP synthase-like glutamine amidotransferase